MVVIEQRLHSIAASTAASPDQIGSDAGGPATSTRPQTPAAPQTSSPNAVATNGSISEAWKRFFWACRPSVDRVSNDKPAAVAGIEASGVLKAAGNQGGPSSQTRKNVSTLCFEATRHVCVELAKRIGLSTTELDNYRKKWKQQHKEKPEIHFYATFAKRVSREGDISESVRKELGDQGGPARQPQTNFVLDTVAARDVCVELAKRAGLSATELDDYRRIRTDRDSDVSDFGFYISFITEIFYKRDTAKIVRKALCGADKIRGYLARLNSEPHRDRKIERFIGAYAIATSTTKKYEVINALRSHVMTQQVADDLKLKYAGTGENIEVLTDVEVQAWNATTGMWYTITDADVLVIERYKRVDIDRNVSDAYKILEHVQIKAGDEADALAALIQRGEVDNILYKLAMKEGSARIIIRENTHTYIDDNNVDIDPLHIAGSGQEIRSFTIGPIGRTSRRWDHVFAFDNNFELTAKQMEGVFKDFLDTQTAAGRP